MNRSTAWCMPLATLALFSVAHASEPGFYFGATASRVEHDIEGTPGLPNLIVFVATPPFFGGISETPIFGPPLVGVITPAPPAYAVVAQSTQIDDVDAGFSATVGYRINRYFAAELTYADFGEYERSDRFTGFPAVIYKLGVTGPSVSVLGSLPVGEQWELFLRGGVLFADQEVTTRVGGSRARWDFSDEVVMAGAGVEWAFAPRWAARLEYQRTDDLKYGDTNGQSSIDQASLSVLFKL